MQDATEQRSNGKELYKMQALIELLQSGFGLTAVGINFCYTYNEALNFGAFKQSVQDVADEVIPYKDLLPLLRPDSPVARMLRERGLWPKAKPR